MAALDLPPSAGPEATVSVSAVETGYVECDRAQIVDPCASERIKIPVIAFLIEKDGKTYTFDLGLRPDLFALPQYIQPRHSYAPTDPQTCTRCRVSRVPAHVPSTPPCISSGGYDHRHGHTVALSLGPRR